MNMHLSKPVAVLSGLFMVVAMQLIHAQGYAVDSQIIGQLVGGGTYTYTLTLNNESSATSSIGTFWFAWTDNGYDLLPSMPTVRASDIPAGWSATVLGGPYSDYGYTYPDGYSIEFTSLTPLAPGGTLTFKFRSLDSPAVISGNSPLYGIPVGTSFVYAGSAYADAGNQFLVVTAPVPEPSTISLMVTGIAGLLFLGRKKSPLVSSETRVAGSRLRSL
jgi:PEP-CTERM motif